MKSLFVLFLFIAPAVRATTYYLAASGSDNHTAAQAQNPATPWQSLLKINQFFSSLKPGDSVLLQRGDVFYGSLVPNKSGTAAAPIVIGAYGVGAMPLISGFTTVRDWTALGNGVWESAGTVSKLPTCNLVTLNGVNVGMGRYPDADAAADGYLKPDAVRDNTIIEDAELPLNGPDFSGGEIVVRRSRFQLFRYSLAVQNGRTITYQPAYAFKTGMGYFVQNHPATLTKQGEWYYNPQSGRLRMHFGSRKPADYIVKAATTDTLAYLYNLNYITIDGIGFEGANASAVVGYSATANNVLNCAIRYAGQDGIRMNTSRDCTISGNVIEDVSNNGITLTLDRYYAGYKVQDNVLKRIGIIRGGGLDGDNKFNAISIRGSQCYVERNRIDSVGYAGIVFGSHDSIYLRRNFITHWCLTIDDGGAIYTVQHSARLKTLSHRVVEDNIMLWSGNPKAGTSSTAGAAYGVYIDDGSNGVDILNNTVAYTSKEAYYLHNAFTIRMRGNTAFGFPSAALRLTHNGDYARIRNIDVKQNIFVANENTASSGEAMVYAQTDDTDPDISAWGVVDSNWYASPADVAQAFKYRAPGGENFIPFGDWKAKTAWDAHSTLLSQTNGGARSRPHTPRFEYNATAAPITVSLEKKYTDARGTVYSGMLTLAPYSSVVLLADESSSGRYKMFTN